MAGDATNDRLFVASSSSAVREFVTDTTPLQLTNFTIDLNAGGTITLMFTEAVVDSEFNPAALTVLTDLSSVSLEEGAPQNLLTLS